MDDGPDLASTDLDLSWAARARLTALDAPGRAAAGARLVELLDRLAVGAAHPAAADVARQVPGPRSPTGTLA